MYSRRFDNDPMVSSADLLTLLWQTGGFRFVISCYRYVPSIPFHFRGIFLAADVLIRRQPTRARLGYVAAAFCGSSSQAAFLSASSLALPRTRPVSPVPVLYLVRRSLALLPLLRVLCLHCRPEALKRQHP
jgi:hypothetical protein